MRTVRSRQQVWRYDPGIIKRKDTLVKSMTDCARYHLAHEYSTDSRPLKDEKDYRGILGAQIRYPDCYGIDMSRWAILWHSKRRFHWVREAEKLLEEVYLAAKADLEKPVSESQNEVKRLYEALDTDAISARISQKFTRLTSKLKWRFSSSIEDSPRDART